MIDLRVLTVECTPKFHKLRMAEYPYRTSSVTEHPPSNFERPLQSTKQIRRVWWRTARLPATHTSCYTHHCSQPSGEREDCAVFLLIFGNRLRVVDGRVHSKFCRLQMSGFFGAVGSLYYWWYNIYHELRCLGAGYITPQISPGCPGNVIYFIQ